jgi:hypothetical protein
MQGSSVLMGYMTLLLRKLFEEPHINDWSILLRALDILEKLYVWSCECLSLNAVDSFGECCVRTEPATLPPDTQCPSANIDDDIDWFFDSHECHSSFTSQNQASDNVPSSYQQSPAKSTRTVPTLDLLLEGLQHSLTWEYDMHTASLNTMALPMIIASDIWRSLVSDKSERALITSCLLDTPSPDTGYDASEDGLQQAAAMNSIPRLISCVGMHVVHSSRPSAYDVYGQSVVAFSNQFRERAYDATVQSYDGLLHVVKKKQLEGPGITRVVLIESPIYIDDTTESGAYLEGSGASQQALDIQNKCVVVYSTTNSATHRITSSQREESAGTCVAGSVTSENTTYLTRIMNHLRALDVHLIVCVEPLPSKLVDACYGSNIAILSCSKRSVHTMARLLADLEVVEDILDLDLSCVSSGYVIDVLVRDGLRVMDVDEGGAGVEPDDKVMVVLSPKHLPGHHTSVGHNSHVQSRGQVHGHVSVVLKAPACIIGRHVKDRVTRCLNRIDHAFHRNGGVMVGAGLVDVLCTIRLREERKRLQCVSEEQASESASVCRLLKCFEGVFEDFSYSVNTNNGVSPEEAMEQWHRSVCSLQQILVPSVYEKGHDDDGGDGDGVVGVHSGLNGTENKSEDWARRWKQSLMELSWEQKCYGFEPPIQLHHDKTIRYASSSDYAGDGSYSSGSCSRCDGKPIVLDVKSLRVEAMRTAIYVVKSILGAADIVTNASSNNM